MYPAGQRQSLMPAGGGSWSHLSLCLFCLGCDRRAAAQEEKSGRNGHYYFIGSAGTIPSLCGVVPKGQKWEECCAVPFRDVDEPTSSLEDDEDVWCHPDEDSSRCQREYCIKCRCK
ncbi:hypothetical protein DPMN_159930 [Dreissena polymorpha]|uniref:Secreted protein n=1 Tax=Dreissena polymorpha TaxID=45954 RepID=A0A9D4EJX1_DREPO|nr:hypothetical protein DPMN_159930 [Dreissena polymorpha]